MNELQPTEQILQAAFRCLAEKGSNHVSLRDIAKEAGVALSQLHYYFGSREGLLVAAASEMLREQVTRLQAELRDVADPAQRVRQAIQFISRQRRENASWIRVRLDLLSMAAWSPKLAEETRHLHDELLAVILSESARTGNPKLQSQSVARLVLGALDGLAMQAMQGADPADLDAAYDTLEHLLTAILSGKAPTSQP